MIIIWKISSFIATETLFWMYRGVMWLKVRRDTLPWYIKAPCYLFVVIGYAADIAYNVVFGSIQFRDWPRELTFTARLKRYKYDIKRYKYDIYTLGWRYDLALRICARLDPYDPAGKHC